MARGIIGPGFDDYVQGQINLRQKNNRAYNQSDLKSINIVKYQNANTAFLRLSSGVNINGSSDQARSFQLFNTQFGVKNNNGTFDYQIASGVNLGNYNSAYGFLSNSSYGYVPPPGLISADVKSLNRGSLREATIQMKCHSADQLEVINNLYLRLGFSMLLEWGWSHYFNNKGEYKTNYHNVSNYFFDEGHDQNWILNAIQIDRSGSNGNYDAMYGVVKNYSWSLEKDGSYDITLNLVSVGDVIESLKGNKSTPTTTSTTTPDSIPDENTPPIVYNKEKSNINRILYSLTDQIKPNSFSEYAYLQSDQLTTSNINSWTGLKNTQNNNVAGKSGEVVAAHFPDLKGVSMQSSFNAQYFIKLGAFLRILQNYCLLYDTSKKDKTSLFNIDFDYENNFMFTFPRHCSLDPRVAMIPLDQDVQKAASSTSTTSVASSYSLSIEDYYWNEVIVDLYNFERDFSNQAGTLTYTGIGADRPIVVINNQAESRGYNGKVVIDSGGINAGPGVVVDVTDLIAKVGALGTKFKSWNSLDDFTPNSWENGTALKFDYATVTAVTNPTPTPLSDLNNLSIFEAKDGNGNTVDAKTLKDLLTQNSAIRDKFVDDVKPKLSSASQKFITGVEGETYLYKNQELVTSKDYIINGTNDGGNPAQIKFIVKTFRAQFITIVNANKSFYNSPVSSTTGKDTSNNFYAYLNPGADFKIDKDKYPFIGKTMSVYLNMDYIARTLDSYIDVKTGAIAVYDLLDKLMNGVQNALGNVNNFNVTYDETSNTFHILDSTFIPGMADLKPEEFKKKPVEFITHTLEPTKGSFIREASVKTQLSNNFATSVTVGAQANGNVVGENSTALSKWNTGLTDRIITSKSADDEPTSGDIESTFISNVSILNQLQTFINDGNITNEQIDGAKNAGVDLFKYEIGTYVSDGTIPGGVGFLPINLELTMDGLSGMRIYESYTADTRLLPKNYKDAIQFIITGISHKIQKDDWTTTITSISGPKPDGKVGKPKPIKFDLKKGQESTASTLQAESDCQSSSLPNQSTASPKIFTDKNVGTKAGVKLNNISAKNQKYIWEEYLPELEKIPGLTKGLKLLITAQAIEEGFYPGARAYRTKNPGNIGNTDSGANKDLGTLKGGIQAQIDYIKEAANSSRKKGHHAFKKYNQGNYFSPELNKCVPGFSFDYVGEVGQYLTIYATGTRLNNNYLEFILGFFKYNGIDIKYNTKLSDIIQLN